MSIYPVNWLPFLLLNKKKRKISKNGWGIDTFSMKSISRFRKLLILPVDRETADQRFVVKGKYQ